MAIINRITTWVANQILTSANLNGEFNNIVNTINNVDAGTTALTNLKATTATITTLTTTTGNITTFQINGVTFPYTNWASYTPTVTGCGTVSQSSAWRQVGDTIYVRCFISTGTVTGSQITITLPNSTTINYAKLDSGATNVLGHGQVLLTAAGPTGITIASQPIIFADGSTTTVVYFGSQTGSNAAVKQTGTNLFNNADSISLEFSYPV